MFKKKRLFGLTLTDCVLNIKTSFKVIALHMLFVSFAYLRSMIVD